MKSYSKLLVGVIFVGVTGLVIARKVADSNVKTDIDIDSLLAKELRPDHSIRYIDSMKTMQESSKGKQVAGELETKRTKWHEEITSMGEKLQRDVQAYADKQLTMSESARTKEEKRLAHDKRDYEALVQEREQDFKVAMGKATDQLLHEVESVVSDLAKKEGWDAVLDTMTGRVFYASPEVEVTDSIVTAWDTQFKDQATVKA